MNTTLLFRKLNFIFAYRAAALSLCLTVMLLCLQCLGTAGTGAEVWITPTGSGGGTGTAEDPFSAPDADSI
jgi:hypothetical protein